MLGSRKAVSSSIVALTIIVVILAIFVILSAGLLTFKTSVIKAKIYSPDNNIGVLNEEGVFDITIENHVNTTRTFAVIIDADGHVLFNETVAIGAVSSRNLTITQKLIFTGLWAIELQENGRIIDSYSFTTLTNKAEADMQINQLNNVRFNNNLSLAATIISSLSLGVSIYVVLKQRRTSKNSS